jgi:hypothetical protein
MKATINGIQFEGTPQEMLELLASSPDTNKTQKQSVENPVSETSLETQEQSNSKYFPGTDEFVSALFRYKPSNTSMGREAYVVQMLATGQSYTVKQLVRSARTELHTVKQAIDRAVAADCVIHATRLEGKQFSGSQSLTLSSRVKMISLGSVARAKEVKSSYQKKNNKKISVESSSDLKNLKIGAAISTGSPPITKIIYAEDRKKNEQK